MNFPNYQEKLCNKNTGVSGLTCNMENLVLLENLENYDESDRFDPNYPSEYFLKTCQICGQVYLEKSVSYQKKWVFSHFYQIEGHRLSDCLCIGYLKPVKVLFEEKSNEGDAM